ncbi:hypothetical protein DSLASN_23880 [Desulfoluna limicola]|uniref:Uncharacterized protein n=1 Tax=Desulfoluna limicola TaxID=2810562 RepID=A0ABN6F5G8_9BACT|nr:hypothetical protein [Desulfoluna limicola]BCS96756.1 hypothetical protein DSLASN_23880 [Desulfoluna limicola]
MSVEKKAFGGKGGVATQAKNTLKAGCGFVLAPVPRANSYPPLSRELQGRFLRENLIIKWFKCLAPGTAAGG